MAFAPAHKRSASTLSRAWTDTRQSDLSQEGLDTFCSRDLLKADGKPSRGQMPGRLPPEASGSCMGSSLCGSLKQSFYSTLHCQGTLAAQQPAAQAASHRALSAHAALSPLYAPAQIAGADPLESATRQLAAECLVTLCEAREKAPGMMRKLPQFLSQFFQCLLGFLHDIEARTAPLTQPAPSLRSSASMPRLLVAPAMTKPSPWAGRVCACELHASGISHLHESRCWSGAYALRAIQV